jgi:hypothetical protein
MNKYHTACPLCEYRTDRPDALDRERRGSIGQTDVKRDRFNYITAISESRKQQAFLNIVEPPYVNVPIFTEVDRVINGYELEGTFTASGSFAGGTKRQAYAGDLVKLRAGGQFLPDQKIQQLI